MNDYLHNLGVTALYFAAVASVITVVIGFAMLLDSREDDETMVSFWVFLAGVVGVLLLCPLIYTVKR